VIHIILTICFSNVSIKSISPEDEKVKDLLVKIKERNCGYGEFRVGYATEEGLRGSIEVGHINLYGYGRDVSIRADADENGRKYMISFKEPWLFNHPYDATIYLIRQYLQRDSYAIRKSSATVGIKKDFTETLKGVLQYELEYDRLSDVESEAIIIPEDEGTNRICTVSPYLVRDSRNDPFNPTRGSLNSFRFDYADEDLGSELRFQKIIGRSSWYFPLRRNITLALSFRGGYGFSIGSETTELPINKRFFLGGRNTVRGFVLDSIGPKGDGDVPIGGNVMTNYNAEFRLSFGKSWGGLIFYDAGNIWANSEYFEADDLRDAVGLGFRYITVAGPISLDVGRKLDRKPGESLTEWYFTIGNIF
jgi:outer membrane protein insertion porin family